MFDGDNTIMNRINRQEIILAEKVELLKRDFNDGSWAYPRTSIIPTYCGGIHHTGSTPQLLGSLGNDHSSLIGRNSTSSGLCL